MRLPRGSSSEEAFLTRVFSLILINSHNSGVRAAIAATHLESRRGYSVASRWAQSAASLRAASVASWRASPFSRGDFVR
jgi:hypothetical protein